MVRILAIGAAALALLSAGSAGASAYVGNTGLAGPDVLVDFNSNGLAQDAALGGVYSGLSFTNGFQDFNYNGSFPNQAGGQAINFTGNTDAGVVVPFIIDFSAPVTAAVFAYVTNASPVASIIRSYLGGTLVESQSVFADTTNPINYYGFTGSLFDRIVINPETAVNQAMVLDNLQYNRAGAVPEPAAWGLMIMGFGGIGAAMRRRRLIAAAV